jgi:CubicO group peptidase (beta-lactamase class C family)
VPTSETAAWSRAPRAGIVAVSSLCQFRCVGRAPVQDTGTPEAITSPFRHVRGLMESGKLAAVLRSVAEDGAVALHCLIDGQQHTFASDGDRSNSSRMAVEIGCITKNLTALLIALAVSEGRIRFDDPVADSFPQQGAIDPALRVYHLLNHSHGLDGSALECIPYTSTHHIDEARIWQAVRAAPAIAPPGAIFYYYGNVGMWLAGAILEKLHGMTFAALLQRRILAPLGVDSQRVCPQEVCPASGGIALSGSELLRLCHFHLLEHVAEAKSAICHLRDHFGLELPKWPPLADASALGWFRYRGRSFGMFGQGKGGSAVMLVSPAEASALVLTGTGELAAQKARSAVFGSLLSATQVRPPQLLTREQRKSLPMDAIAGRYLKASLALDIGLNGDGELQASVSHRDQRGNAGAPFLTKLLLPAADDFLFPARPDVHTLPFLKLEGRTGGIFMYASTGKHVMRREC